MNYKKIYDNLIRSRKASPPTGYFERHHIIPKCIGGSDEDTNLVNLTPEEHFIAHKLLAKMFPGNYKLVKAVICMGMSSRTHQRQFSKSYGWERRQMSILQSGEGNPFYGKHHTEEHIKYMSSFMKGREITWGDKISKTKRENPAKWTEESKLKHSINQSGSNNGMYNRKHSKESIDKMKSNRPDQNGSNNPSAKAVIVNGIQYDTMKAASEATGLSMYKLRKIGVQHAII